YVTGTLPSTVTHETETIAFFAHVDTAREVSGANVNPQRIRYEGGDIPLGSSGSAIRPSESPQLAHHQGHELITTDGTTLLGADDKAGIAEIMAAVAYMKANSDVPHGTVKVAFNPDEEIGRGVIHFPIDTLGAVAAYTIDGSTAGEVQSETFSGAQVRMAIKGRAIHPGWAKGEMVNAIKLAAAVIEKLPKDRLSPETTEEREGYVHPVVISGDSSEVELRFIVRDFENDLLDEHVDFLCTIAAEVAATDDRCSIQVESFIQYRNMRDTLTKHPAIVANLEEAVRRTGLEPKRTAIRGGTDGSALTEMGLPTPNLFTGGHDAHSEREWICVEDMGLAAAAIVELAKIWAE
ncbi:MAG: peptidase T, partial [Gaiellaceae bacterium]